MYICTTCPIISAKTNCAHLQPPEVCLKIDLVSYDNLFVFIQCSYNCFQNISFYGHVWLRRGPNTCGKGNNSSIKSFKLQTLYTRVSSSHYRSMTITAKIVASKMSAVVQIRTIMCINSLITETHTQLSRTSKQMNGQTDGQTDTTFSALSPWTGFNPGFN